MRKVTLKDIASKLGVTVGTVSHVLNGIDDISEETKEKVLKTARELGYISNSAAVSLRSGKTHTIAVIVPDISNLYISHQVKLIETYIRQLNYSVFIQNTNENEETEYEAIVSACSRQVDGILLCPCQKSTKNVEFLDKLQIPYLLLCRYFENYNADFISVDDYKGGKLAGEYLLNKGFVNPLYFGAFDYVQPSSARFSGLKDTFKEKGYDITDKFIQMSPVQGSMESAIEEGLKNNKFDSVVAFSDFVAFEVIYRLKQIYKDKKIPVIGFDAVNLNLKLPFESVSVGMTTDTLATETVNALIDKINNPSSECRKLMDVKIYEFDIKK